MTSLRSFGNAHCAATAVAAVMADANDSRHRPMCEA